MALKIITNDVPRSVIYGHELTEKEKAEFDYIEKEYFDCHMFVQYRGWIYDLSEFMRTDSMMPWDGVMSESYFSGILVRFCGNDYHDTMVVMGRYYEKSET